MTTWKFAETPQEVGCAQRIRFGCFHDELGIAIRFDPELGLDVSGRDNWESVAHVLVYDGVKPVGTARLTRPDAQLATITGTRFGFEGEAAFDFTPLAGYGAAICEVAKVCVLREARPGTASLCLYAAFVEHAKVHELSALVGLVDCASEVLGDALLMRDVLERRGLVSEELQVRPRQLLRSEPANDPVGRAFYANEVRAGGAELDLARLRVAPAIESFIQNLGARAIGLPVRHPVYPRFVMPMLAKVAEIPARTLALIDSAARLRRVPQLLRPPLRAVANDLAPTRRSTP